METRTLYWYTLKVTSETDEKGVFWYISIQGGPLSPEDPDLAEIHSEKFNISTLPLLEEVVKDGFKK